MQLRPSLLRPKTTTTPKACDVFLVQRPDQKFGSSCWMTASFFSNAFMRANVDSGNTLGINPGGRCGESNSNVSGSVPLPLFLSRVRRPHAALTSQSKRSVKTGSEPGPMPAPNAPRAFRPTGFRDGLGRLRSAARDARFASAETDL